MYLFSYNTHSHVHYEHTHVTYKDKNLVWKYLEVFRFRYYINILFLTHFYYDYYMLHISDQREYTACFQMGNFVCLNPGYNCDVDDTV